MNHADFQEILEEKGRELYRDMPWRRDTSPYAILVSELMLQQTQVSRVVPKYEAFMIRFPNLRTLAAAQLSEVLQLWQGLGYNRRAKYLHMAAQQVVTEYGGELPVEYEALKRLSGIGPGTAGAIMTYAFNQPVVFIETNVRTVYFHHFFPLQERVSDSELVPLVEATLSHEHPREFYWALMDYGAWLKQNSVSSRNSQSRHYKKQSAFRGSLREVRGQIVRLLTAGDVPRAELERDLATDKRFMPALEGLVKDGLITETDGVFHITRV